MTQGTDHQHEGDEPEVDLRFVLANERTLLSYQRTAMGLVAGAVAVAHYLSGGFLVSVLAGGMIVTGVVASVGGYARYRHAEHAIRTGTPMKVGPTPSLLMACFLLCVAVAVLYVLGVGR